jgi:L-threonylcarbamoyladenylate synthase
VTLRLHPDPAGIFAAVSVLLRGGLVAFPTETVYGLGADATAAEAVAGIYAAKGRPRFNPLIAHVADLDVALEQGIFSPHALALARAFWPGPLTLVVPAAPCCTVSDLARAGLDSVALRVPAHPVARALIAAAGVPVAAPSANRSGRISPTTAAHVRADLDGRIDALLDGGPTAVGVESTIVSCLGEPTLLRPGGVTREAIEAVLGRRLASPAPDGPTVAPGMLLSHYAPRAAVRLGADALRPGEAGLDFGGCFVGQGGPVLDLSPRRDLAEAAANLFGFLRRLDEGLGGTGDIAVAPIPAEGLGEAIADRLMRAAAER